MSESIKTKLGVELSLRALPGDLIAEHGAGVILDAQREGASAQVFLSLQDMRDLLSKLASAIQPAAERADELGLDDQDGPQENDS